MGWGVIVLIVAYIVAICVVMNSDSKKIQVGAMVIWGVLGLLIGHFAWHIFG